MNGKATLLGTALMLILAISASAAAGERTFFPHEAVRAWHGGRFAVIRIDALEDLQNRRVMVENQIASFPDEMRALQQEIRTNPGLAAALKARGVQIGNIGAAQRTLSGSLIFYLR